MKHLLLTTIAALVLVGCGPSEPLDISIHDAARIGDIEAVKQHLAAGTDVNAKKQGGLGETPLHYAAKERRTEIVKLLINKGANVNAIGDGRTPLRHLIGSAGPVKETEAISKLLRKHGGKER